MSGKTSGSGIERVSRNGERCRRVWSMETRRKEVSEVSDRYGVGREKEMLLGALVRSVTDNGWC